MCVWEFLCAGPHIFHPQPGPEGFPFSLLNGRRHYIESFSHFEMLEQHILLVFISIAFLSKGILLLLSSKEKRTREFQSNFTFM